MNCYQERILDHYHNPRTATPLLHPDYTVEVTNAACGDKLTLQASFAGSVMTHVSCTGMGCILSQAAASMVTHASINQRSTEILAMTDEHVLALLGMAIGPNRLQCALLVLKALNIVAQKRKHD